MTSQIKNIARSLLFTLTALTGSISLIVLLSPLIYQVFNSFIHLEVKVGLTEDQLYDNYQAIIDYLLNPMVSEFVLPDFAASMDGIQHFAEVKVLVQLTMMFAIFLTLILTYSVMRIRKQRRRDYYLKMYLFVCKMLPLGVLFIAVIAFDKLFIFFHQLFFRNDLWLFDPLTDPIINVLPESYFFLLLVAIFILYEILLFFFQFFIKKKI